MLKNKIKNANQHYKTFLDSIYSKRFKKIKDLKKTFDYKKYHKAITALENQYVITNMDNKFNKNNIESYIDHSLKLINYVDGLIKIKSDQEIEEEHIKQLRLKCAKVMQYVENISSRDLSH